MTPKRNTDYMRQPKWRKVSWKNLLVHGDYDEDFLGYRWAIKELDWEVFIEANKNEFGEIFWTPVISFGKNVDYTKFNDISFEDLEDAKEYCENWVLKFLKKAAKLLK